MARYRGNTTQRGLGHTHQQLRAHLLRVLQDGTPCRRCTWPMVHPDRCHYGPCFYCTLDLGHYTDRVLGGGGPRELEHRRCNRSAGARLGNALRTRASRTQARARKRQHSRDW